MNPLMTDAWQWWALAVLAAMLLGSLVGVVVLAKRAPVYGPNYDRRSRR